MEVGGGHYETRHQRADCIHQRENLSKSPTFHKSNTQTHTHAVPSVFMSGITESG